MYHIGTKWNNLISSLIKKRDFFICIARSVSATPQTIRQKGFFFSGQLTIAFSINDRITNAIALLTIAPSLPFLPKGFFFLTIALLSKELEAVNRTAYFLIRTTRSPFNE